MSGTIHVVPPNDVREHICGGQTPCWCAPDGMIVCQACQDRDQSPMPPRCASCDGSGFVLARPGEPIDVLMHHRWMDTNAEAAG